MEDARNALIQWDTLVHKISPLREVDEEGNLVKEWPAGENTVARFMGCFSIPAGVNLMILLTLIGFAYAVFNIVRASK
jgi:hypothetical protein